MRQILASKWTKVVLFLLCLAPAADTAWGLYRTFQGEFLGPISANPIEYVTHTTGDWTLRFLLITLTITPLRLLLNQPLMTRFRRMFGLFSFFYGFLHLMTWVWLDRFFDPAGIWRGMWEDLVKRPYITVGMLGFLIMVPLAITSTNGWVRRLTWKRWQRLHRIVYLAPAAGVVHYLWLVKSDIRLPVMYGVLLGILMVCRIFVWIRTRSRQRRAAAQAREPREAVTRAAE